MSDDADHFRERARECRDLSQTELDSAHRAHLAEVADDLDAEADKMEAELESKTATKH